MSLSRAIGPYLIARPVVADPASNSRPGPRGDRRTEEERRASGNEPNVELRTVTRIAVALGARVKLTLEKVGRDARGGRPAKAAAKRKIV